MKRNKLWTKDFSLITFSTILSVIGGQAMDLPISLLVFDKTKSTFLSAIIMVCGMLPNILFSIAVAPIIDKVNFLLLQKIFQTYCSRHFYIIHYCVRSDS